MARRRENERTRRRAGDVPALPVAGEGPTRRETFYSGDLIKSSSSAGTREVSMSPLTGFAFARLLASR